MAYLINRNAPARLTCLHNLCNFIADKYEVGQEFSMKDIKYNPSCINIFDHCNLLITVPNTIIKYCPYKENPLNKSGCSLTNAIESDSTKSKEVSNTVNALHALGFLFRDKRKIYLTEEGKRFADTSYETMEMLSLIRKAVLRYGVFVGLLAQIHLHQNDDFDTNLIQLGYPNSKEKIQTSEGSVLISSGSEKDSNTRTKSCLLAWGVTCGFFIPKELYQPTIDANTLNHVYTSSYILSKSRSLNAYQKLNLPEDIFNSDFIVERPLSYNNLTKNTGALRENNQEKIRKLTLKFEPIIQNRRFAIVYALNQAFLHNKTLNLNALVKFMFNNKDYFMVDIQSDLKTFTTLISKELTIAFMVGIPYKILPGQHLKPLTGINLKELNSGAPKELIELMDSLKV